VQDKLAQCAARCADEYEKKVPSMQRIIVERLKGL
jgi:hypothetical protein